MSKPGTSVAIGLAGLGIGWLVGLSTTPVVAAVIATLLAAAAAIAGAGISTGGGAASVRVAPGPLAVLVVGIAIGATCGMEYRIGSWFGTGPDSKEPNLDEVVSRWVALGAQKSDVVQRLLDRELPAQGGGGVNSESRQAVPKGLVSDAMSVDGCDELQAAPASDILNVLAASPDATVRALGDQALELKLPESFAVQLRKTLCPHS